MRKLLNEGRLLLGEKQKQAPQKTPSKAPAKKAPKGPTKSATYAAKIAKAAKKEEEQRSVQAMVARVKRLRQRYTKAAQEFEKLAPSIAQAAKTAKGEDLFQPNPNTTPSYPPVTDLSKGW
jgi:hypothetical protein